jgi:prepilin signal peptidase PulO-like enzyme (type II secretory pathway)
VIGIIGAVPAAIFFGCVALVAVHLSHVVCAGIPRADDGPPAGTPPVVVLVVASAVLGGVLVAKGTTPLHLAIGAILVFALVACWCSDLICGILPDAFTLAPLAAVLAIVIFERDWGAVVAAIAAFVPFALTAYFTRGYGMGWGDAKLVALCGAALGAASLIILTLAVAGVAALIGHRVTGGKKGEPIAFAPYIAAFTALLLPWGLMR